MEQWNSSKLRSAASHREHAGRVVNREKIIRWSHLERAAGFITSWNQDCWENFSDLRYVDDTSLMAESEEELKRLFMKVKEESEKAGLKLNIQKTKIMASGPITSREIDGENVETVSDFIFLGSEITVDSDCRHEIKRCLLLGRIAMTNLDSVYYKVETLLSDKGPSSQSYGFSSSHVWMWVGP